MGNTAKHCRLGLFQDSDFVGGLEDSKPTSGGTLSVFAKGRDELRGDIAKDDSGSFAVFTAASEIGRCSKLAQNFKVAVSRFVDTSSTTQMV